MPESAETGGAVRVLEPEAIGMLLIKADLASAPVAAAVERIFGVGVPGRCEAEGDRERAVAWMAPDELLALVPAERAREALAELQSALAGEHALCADVSAMRACFEIQGEGVRDVLAKGTPADVSPSAFGPGGFRRTRMGQLAAAIWMLDGRSARIFCLRSEAAHLREWLDEAVASLEADEVFFRS